MKRLIVYHCAPITDGTGNVFCTTMLWRGTTCEQLGAVAGTGRSFVGTKNRRPDWQVSVRANYYHLLLLLLNACVRVADVMTLTFVSPMPVHNVCRICIIIKE